MTTKEFFMDFADEDGRYAAECFLCDIEVYGSVSGGIKQNIIENIHEGTTNNLYAIY